MSLLEKYLAPNEKTYEDVCRRVSKIMLSEEDQHEMLRALVERKVILNSPAMVNAMRGKDRNMHACHLLKVYDNVRKIFEAVTQSALIFKSGGGVGLDMSEITPAGTPLGYNADGVASGPITFLKNFDAAAQTISEGGLRRAAIMGTLPSTHQDALDWIKAKKIDKTLSNFNLSLTYANGPDTSPEVFAEHCKFAYHNGEPGIIYLDLINADVPQFMRQELGDIESVNACSEQPLWPFGSCVLGHVVLPNAIQRLGDYSEFERLTELMVKALDRLIDINHYPIPEIAQQARNVRRIGCGVLGWDDLLRREGIQYASQESIDLVHEIGPRWIWSANKMSRELAKELGGYRPGQRRNVALTTIAPTGHTATLVDASKSIYPKSYSQQLNLSVEQHLNHLAAWQEYVDSAISYTVCFKNDAPESTVEKVYRGAYDRGIKCISVYRDGSREDQPEKAYECVGCDSV